MITKPISELHAEHTGWLSKLDFYTDEVRLMTSRIGLVAAKHPGEKDVLARVEHFQNQLIVQKNNIDELRHSINDHEIYLENRADENPLQGDARLVNDHSRMRDQFTAFENVFNELREELNNFLSKTM